MTTWNERARIRSFLAAALVTAVCGAIFSTTDSTPRLAASDTGTRPDLSLSRSASFAADPDAEIPADPLAAEDAAAIASAEDRAELKDAVGAPSLSAATLGSGPAGAAGAWTAAARAAASPGGATPSAAAARLAAERLGATGSKSQAPLKRSAGLERASRAGESTFEKSGRGRDLLSSRTGARSSSPRPSAAGEGGRRAGSSERTPFTTGAAEAMGAQAGPDGGAGGAGARAPGASGPRRSRLTAFKPALLSKLLGPKPLRPPRGSVRAPEINPWRAHPAPQGLRPMTALEAEGVEGSAAGEREKISGVRRADSWGWVERSGERVWLWPSPDGPALLSHEGHWWWQSRGVWFLLHDGEPWGWRYLAEWRREGLVHGSGTQMIYSDDGARVGVVTPGEGAVLYDSTTGAELGRWRADELPKPRAARAPTRLRLP